MKQIKTLFLALALLAPQPAHAGWWDDLLNWAVENKNAALCTLGLATACSIAYKYATRCNDRRTINNVEYLICPDANLAGKNLQNADLQKADLRRANLEGAVLSEAILKNANLSGANLTRVNFYKADLSGANFKNANLSYADVTDAIFTDANFEGATIEGIRGFKARGVQPSIMNIKRRTPSFKFNLQPTLPKATIHETEPAINIEKSKPRLREKTTNINTTVATATTARLQSTTSATFIEPKQGSHVPQSRQLIMQKEAGPTEVFVQKPTIDTVREEPSKLKIAKKISATLPHKPTEIAQAPTNETAIIQAPKGIEMPETQVTAPTVPAETKSESKKQETIKTTEVKQAAPTTKKTAAQPIEKPKQENSLIKNYLKTVDTIFTPHVALGKHYLESLTELTESIQPYPALLKVHNKFVDRPAREFYKYMKPAEQKLRKKNYSEHEIKTLLEDLFKKIRTTLWTLTDIDGWVATIIKNTFKENKKDGTITYTRLHDKESLINAIKESFTNRLKVTIRPLMIEQTPIAELYVYFDQIEKTIESARPSGANTVGPLSDIKKSLAATIYATGKTLKSEFEPLKNTLEILPLYLDQKVELPKQAAQKSNKIREIKERFKAIRTFMDLEYDTKKNDKKAMAELTQLKTSFIKKLEGTRNTLVKENS